MALALDVLVDIVGVEALPRALADCVRCSPGPAPSSLPAPVDAFADPFAGPEAVATQCYTRSLVFSLWLLHARDAASLWYAAAVATATSCLVVPGSGRATGATTTAESMLGSPSSGVASPICAVHAAPLSPGQSLEGAARSRVRRLCAEELSRAAARLALLSKSSHQVCSGLPLVAYLTVVASRRRLGRTFVASYASSSSGDTAGIRWIRCTRKPSLALYQASAARHAVHPCACGLCFRQARNRWRQRR